jgi:eukaryotic-like serine/threonine-protein kinase
VGERLAELVPAGQLGEMAAVIDDPAGRAADATEAEQAAHVLVRLRRELDALTQGATERAESARRLGQELAVGGGVAALAAALAFAALG